MNHGTKNNRKRWEALTHEQRVAAVEAIRTKHQTAEYREQEEKDREAIRTEFPSRVIDDDLKVALAALRLERDAKDSASLICRNGRESTGRLRKLEARRDFEPDHGNLANLRRGVGQTSLVVACRLIPPQVEETGFTGPRLMDRDVFGCGHATGPPNDLATDFSPTFAGRN